MSSPDGLITESIETLASGRGLEQTQAARLSAERDEHGDGADAR